MTEEKEAATFASPLSRLKHLLSIEDGTETLFEELHAQLIVFKKLAKLIQLVVSDRHMGCDLLVFILVVLFDFILSYSKRVLVVELLPRLLLPSFDVVDQILADCYGCVSKLVHIVFHLLKPLPLLL